MCLEGRSRFWGWTKEWLGSRRGGRLGWLSGGVCGRVRGGSRLNCSGL